MSSKYKDTMSVVQVIGCIFKDPSLIGMEDKYTITEEDFTEEFHKVVYGTIYKLFQSGANSISIDDITLFLSSRPKSKVVYEKNRGDDWIEKASQIASLDTFGYYYHRLKVMSLLRAYDNYGVDVSDIYDPDNIDDSKKKQQQEEYIDNASLERIADEIDGKISEIRLKYVNDDFGEAQQAGTGIMALIQQYKERPEVGFPLYGQFINTVTRGARPGKFYLRSAATGIGKAIPNDTIIPTPNGYRKVSDIKPGDYLFGQDGKPTKVLQIHPQPQKKDIWKVTFSDGRTAECCGEHLWEYRYKSSNGYNYKVEDIQTIYNRSLILGKEFKFYIRINKPVEYSTKQYSISPYDLGFSLGKNNKEIPKEYLLGDISQRLSLLQGLLDSNNKTNLITKNLEFRDSAIELCRSLGYIVNTSIDKEYYIINIQIPKDGDHLAIVNIEKTSNSSDMTCFTVDNESHLFLMNDFIVTHNTRSMIADACYVACDKIYDECFGWISNGTKEPALFIATEQDLSEVQTMMLAFLSNVNEEHILYGKYEGDEEDRVIEAARVLQESPLYIEELPDFSLSDVENKIKKNIREHNVKCCFFDYIHSSMKILEEVTRKSGGVKLREDNILFMLSAKLKAICNIYGIFLMSATQLNGSFVDSETPDQNLLRGR